MSRFGLLVTALLVVGGLFVSGGFVEAVSPPPCAAGIGSPLIVDSTQAVSNDPDSGNISTWATDTFTKGMKVWLDEDGVTYCGQTTDSGTFVTNGTVSPEHGFPFTQIVNGTFEGGARYAITGTLLETPLWPTTGSVPENNCGGDGSGCPSGTYSQWLSNYFSGESHSFVNWGWTYSTDNNGTWVNKDTGNIGEIGSVVNTNTNTGYANLQSAIDDATAGDTLKLSENITLSSQVIINKALTLDGNNFTLFAPFAGGPGSVNNSAVNINSSDVTIKNITENGTGSAGIHGINIYLSTNVNLNDVIVTNNSKSGITVNGSIVTVNNITTSDNAWGGINVDQGVGVTDVTTLTVNGISTHTENNADIWRDDNLKTDVTVVDTDGQYSSEVYLHDEDVEGTLYYLLPRYTVTYTAGDNGSITGDLSQNIIEGQAGTVVTAIANDGYHFVDWNDGLTTASRSETNVTGALSFTANFEKDQSNTSGSRRATPATPATPAVPGVSPAIPATPATPGGEVLGAEKFIFTKFMRLGSTGNEVLELQKVLTAQLYYTGPLDGIFGPLTEAAVETYQAAHPPLRIDGIVGPLTRAVLNK